MKWEIALVRAFYNDVVDEEGKIPYYGGLANRTIRLQLNLNATLNPSYWEEIINAACDAWNSAGAGVNITTTYSEENNKIIVANFLDIQGPAGDARTYPDDNVEGTGSLIRIDLKRAGGENLDQNTVMHEIGHLFCLADNPPEHNSEKSLMRYGDMPTSNNSGLFPPQWFDICNVRFRYD